MVWFSDGSENVCKFLFSTPNFDRFPSLFRGSATAFGKLAQEIAKGIPVATVGNPTCTYPRKCKPSMQTSLVEVTYTIPTI